MHIGRGHTAGDVIAVVPDAGVVFAGDLVEYKSACYCGDAHFTDWPATLDHLAELQANALVPGRGAALTTPQMVAEGIALTSDFIATLYGSVQESVAKGRSLKDAFDFARLAMDPKFKTFAIYEHCLPFNVARAYDEARGIEWPVIWTAERDREMWAALQGCASGIWASRFPSGPLMLSLLAVSIALWAAMVFGTLAHLSRRRRGRSRSTCARSATASAMRARC